ncbi:MAG: hypothetical protein ABL962_21995 [Fimbriimonadaceae bacterium]
MKNIQLLVVLTLALAVIGCGNKGTTVIGKDGETITTDGQGNSTVTDKDGKTVDFKNNGGDFSAKSSDGTEVNVSKDGGMTGQNAKGEKFSMGASEVTEADLGVPTYPGSTLVPNRDVKADVNGKHTVMSVRSTSDGAAKVSAFYKDIVTSPVTADMGKMATVSGKLADGREIAVMAMEDAGKTEITITVTGK